MTLWVMFVETAVLTDIVFSVQYAAKRIGVSLPNAPSTQTAGREIGNPLITNRR